MGICKLIDSLLFIYFLFTAVSVLLLNSQIVLPSHIFPSFLIDFKASYVSHFNDYLFAEKPSFFVGLISLELLVQWPLCVANLYGILSKNPWFNTTCLMYGVSAFTATVAILSDMVISHKATNKMLIVYLPFLGFSLVAVFRGLVAPVSTSSVASRKKRA